MNVELSGENYGLWLRRLAGGILVFGIFIRLVQYLYGRSLWLDEASLALNVIERGPADLIFKPLDYAQAAPAGFLLISKLSGLVFGYGERSLRLVPFLAGVLAAYFFFQIGRRFLKPGALVLATFLFTFSYPLAYYAQEFKPYSVDVAVCLGLLSLFINTCQDAGAQQGPLRLGALITLGALTMALSFPQLFVVSALAGTLLLMKYRKAHIIKMSHFGLMAAIWAGSCLFLYILFLRSLESHSGLHEYWAQGFLTFPASFSDLRALGAQIAAPFLAYAGFQTPWFWLVAFLSVVAFAEIIRTGEWHFFSLYLIFGTTLLASLLHKYPFSERLVLFLLPLLFLILAKGVDAATENRPAWLKIGTCLVLMYPFVLTGNLLTRHFIQSEEVRPLLEYYAGKKQPQDCLYIVGPAESAARYYARRMHLSQNEWKFLPLPSDGAILQIDSLLKESSARGWILFSHVLPETQAATLEAIRGQAVEEQHARGASLYLYKKDTAPSSPAN